MEEGDARRQVGGGMRERESGEKDEGEGVESSGGSSGEEAGRNEKGSKRRKEERGGGRASEGSREECMREGGREGADADGLLWTFLLRLLQALSDDFWGIFELSWRCLLLLLRLQPYLGEPGNSSTHAGGSVFRLLLLHLQPSLGRLGNLLDAR